MKISNFLEDSFILITVLELKLTYHRVQYAHLRCRSKLNTVSLSFILGVY